MQLNKKSSILYLFIFVLFFSSCEIINPEETIPSYLRIDEIKLDVNSNLGSNSNKITDAWVYVDDQIIGAYELPAKFPILIEGRHKVLIKAGIKVNGISDTRGAYPFFEGYTTYVDFVKDSVIAITPMVNYYTTTQFVLNEDFESSGILFEKTSRADTTLEKTNNVTDVFEGDYSGIVHLTTDKSLFECKSIEEFVFPSNGKPVYVELNYKSDIPFMVGFFANNYLSSEQHSVLTVNKSDTWNKIYINMTDAASNYSNAVNFNIFIGATLAEGTEATIHLDNIRLVHN